MFIWQFVLFTILSESSNISKIEHRSSSKEVLFVVEDTNEKAEKIESSEHRESFVGECKEFW